jgi:polysaccharide biosynthesis protein PslH
MKVSAGSKEHMDILWLKAGGLLPLDTGGKIRSFQILKQLARKHDITFCTFYKSLPSDPHADLERVFSKVVCQPLEISSGRGFAEFLSYFRQLSSPFPYSMAKYYQPEVRKKVSEVCRGKKFDAIVCDFIFAAGVVPWGAFCPKIFFAHNVEARIWKRHHDVARSLPWKLASWKEYKSMERTERKYIRLADHLITVSETDRSYFSQIVEPGKISVTPTGVDIDFFRPRARETNPASLVFTGSMDWMPNEDAVFYFAERILPSIRSQVPNIEVRVVGRKPSARLRALAETEPAIKVTGAVDDIRPYVHDSAMYIVPLRVGSGTRLKIFEAMAMGKAIVSTSIGAEGLPVRHGENILLADDPTDFANQVVALVQDRAARERLGLAARQLVEQNYGWESVGAHFETILKDVVSRFGGPCSDGLRYVPAERAGVPAPSEELAS